MISFHLLWLMSPVYIFSFCLFRRYDAKYNLYEHILVWTLVLLSNDIMRFFSQIIELKWFRFCECVRERVLTRQRSLPLLHKNAKSGVGKVCENVIQSGFKHWSEIHRQHRHQKEKRVSRRTHPAVSNYMKTDLNSI